MDWLF